MDSFGMRMNCRDLGRNWIELECQWLTQGARRLVLRLREIVRVIHLRDRCVNLTNTIAGAICHLLRVMWVSLLSLLTLLLLRTVAFYPLLVWNMVKALLEGRLLWVAVDKGQYQTSLRTKESDRGGGCKDLSAACNSKSTLVRSGSGYARNRIVHLG